jgi:hypothetical protein
MPVGSPGFNPQYLKKERKKKKRQVDEVRKGTSTLLDCCE